MKTRSWFYDSILVIGLAAVFSFVLVHPVSAQDTIKKHSKTVITLKIVKDENGKKTVIDTTITTDKPLKSKELKAIVSDMGEDVKGENGDMDDFSFSFNGDEFPDSAFMDSIHKMTKDIRCMVRKLHGHHFDMDRFPGGFDYNFNFDLPEPPAPPDPPEAGWDFGDFQHPAPYPGHRQDMEKGPGTLSDLLGDIPLDRVKNFSIKEQKDGTKITIELDRGPVFAAPRSESKVIIIRPDGSVHSQGHDRKMHKKVIIHSGDDKDPEKN